MSLGSLKKLAHKFLYFYLVCIWSFQAFTNPCDCEAIKRAGKCNNPNCIKICGFQTSLNEISSNIVEKCIGTDNLDFNFDKKESVSAFETASAEPSQIEVIIEKHIGQGNLTFNFKKEELSATSISALTKQTKEKIELIQSASKKQVAKNCPGCELNPEISARFKVNPPKKNCPQQYLKTHSYKSSKKIGLQNGLCREDQIFSYSQKYMKDIISGDSEISKKLWKDCPDPCSFDVSYSVRIDEKLCQGDVDVRIDCTHRVEKSFFGVPEYDVSIKYTGRLKCEGKGKELEKGAALSYNKQRSLQ